MRNNAIKYAPQFLPEQLASINLVLRGWDPRGDVSSPPSSVLTKDGSNVVSQLLDQSASGFVFENGTASERPTWIDDELNGKPVFRLDESNGQSLHTGEGSAGWKPDFAAGHGVGYDIFAVVRSNPPKQTIDVANTTSDYFQISGDYVGLNSATKIIVKESSANDGIYSHTSSLPDVEYSIIAVDIDSNWFKASGDQTSIFTTSTVFKVYNSTGNDGTYTVVSSSYDGGPNETTINVSSVTNDTADGSMYIIATVNTQISVSESIPSSTADGHLIIYEEDEYVIGQTRNNGTGTRYGIIIDASDPGYAFPYSVFQDERAENIDLAINSIAWQTGDTSRVFIDSSCDLRGMPGDACVVIKNVDTVWNGDFEWDDFLEPDNIGPTNAIVGADSTSNWFKVSGDQTANFPTSAGFAVDGSTSNDGLYTVSSSSYDGGAGETTINVNESVTDNTADGNILGGDGAYIDITHPDVTDATDDVGSTSGTISIFDVVSSVARISQSGASNRFVTFDTEWHILHGRCISQLASDQFSPVQNATLSREATGELFQDDSPSWNDRANTSNVEKFGIARPQEIVFGGRTNGTAQTFSGDIAEVICSSRPLQHWESGLILQWLSNAYGIKA